MGDHNINLKIQQKGAEKVDKNLKTVSGDLTTINEKAGKLANSGSMAAFAKKVAAVAAAFIALKVVIAGVKKVIGVFTGAIQAFFRQEQSFVRLKTLMKNVKGFTMQAYDSVVKLTEAIQGYGVVADDSLQAGASQLATFKLTADTIKKLLPGLADLMVATYGVDTSQEQAIQSANLLGRVFDGSYGALTRVGISLTDAQKNILKVGTQAEKTATIVEILRSNFGGLNREFAKMGSGIWQRLKNVWSDLDEKFGKTFWEKSGIKLMIEKLTAFLQSPLMNNWVTNLSGGVGSMLKKITDYMTKVGILTGNKKEAQKELMSYKLTGNKNKDGRKLVEAGYVAPSGRLLPQYDFKDANGQRKVYGLGKENTDLQIKKWKKALENKKNTPQDIKEITEELRSIEEYKKKANFITNEDTASSLQNTNEGLSKKLAELNKKRMDIVRKRQGLRKKVSTQGLFGIGQRAQMDKYTNELFDIEKERRNIRGEIKHNKKGISETLMKKEPTPIGVIVKNIREDITKSIKDGFDFLLDGIKKTFTSTKEIISKGIDAAITKFKEIVNSIIKGFFDVVERVRIGFNDVVTAVKNLNPFNKEKTGDTETVREGRPGVILPKSPREIYDTIIKNDASDKALFEKIRNKEEAVNKEAKIFTQIEKIVDEKSESQSLILNNFSILYDEFRDFNNRLKALELQPQTGQ